MSLPSFAQNVLKGDFKIEVRTMYPQRYPSRTVTDFSLEVKDGEATVYLPYMGQVYMPSMSSEGLNFTEKMVKVTHQRDAKGQEILYFILKRHELSYEFVVKAYTNGEADITMRPSNAQPCSYHGDLEVTDTNKPLISEEVYDEYDRFNALFLDSVKYIYRNTLDAPHAVDRWNGAAAIWCQAIFFDMAIQAYACAQADGDTRLMRKYKKHAERLFEGNRQQYVGFNFDDPNTNTGWFVYDDIMWWTIALARAYQVFGDKEYLQLAKKSFDRVWNGSKVVGDDGSYADPKRGLGGGMFWEWQPIDRPQPHKAGGFRSACINFPTVIASSLLYQCAKKRHYLQKAIEIYEWADGTLVSNGRVADGIHDAGPEWNDHLYNQATYIGASHLLYLLTHKQSYLEKAMQGIEYTNWHMSKDGILPREFGPEQGVYTAIYAQYAPKALAKTGRPDLSASIEYYKRQEYHDVYHASGLPALMLFDAYFTKTKNP